MPRITDGNDLEIMGFVSGISKRGVVKLIISTLIVLLLLASSMIGFLVYIISMNSKDYTKGIMDVNSNANYILKQKDDEISQLKRSLDSTFNKK